MSMKKRAAREDDHVAKRNTNFRDDGEEEEVLEFEDPFGDDLEDEEMIESAEDDDEEIVDSENVQMEDDDEEDEEKQVKRVFMPGVDKLGEDEVLDYDSSAYDMYFAMTAEWPALSIDIVRDNLGAVRTRFPMSMYVVAGTQAAKADENQITIMKMSELHKTKHSNDSDSEGEESDDDDDAMDDDPVLESRSIPHKGGVNRIRSMPQSSNIVATWSDLKKVHVWDIAKHLESLDGKLSTPLPQKVQPLHTFSGHPDEGFAMDWSPLVAGRLLTGDCSKFIYLWNHSEGAWQVDMAPFTGHKGSVEDIQCSPTEATVFASCSADHTVRIWDTRRKVRTSALDVTAHNDDVNVISWNHNVAYLLASGSDDGSFKIWDLRNFSANNPVAHFRYHTAPITSIEWHPTDESVLAVAGADNQISVWDMSVEEDPEATAAAMAPDQQKLDLPPQLLFIHQGQTDIKELHFHPQCPGVLVSTAGDGFNVFKPANIS